MASSTRARSSSSMAAMALTLAALLVAAAGPGAAQAPAPSSSSGSSGSCMTEIVSLYPCLGYMSGNASKPSSSCCSALSAVVASNPRCLCTVLGGGAASLGVTINNTRALELPGACTVKTPPPSQCKSVGVPVPSSSPTPATATPSTTPASPAAASTVPVAPAAGTGTKVTQTAESSAGGKVVSILPAVAAVVLSAAVALLHA